MASAFLSPTVGRGCGLGGDARYVGGASMRRTTRARATLGATMADLTLYRCACAAPAASPARSVCSRTGGCRRCAPPAPAPCIALEPLQPASNSIPAPWWPGGSARVPCGPPPARVQPCQDQPFPSHHTETRGWLPRARLCLSGGCRHAALPCPAPPCARLVGWGAVHAAPDRADVHPAQNRRWGWETRLRSRSWTGARKTSCRAMSRRCHWMARTS